MDEFYNFATPANRKYDDTSVYVRVATKYPSSLHASCPLATMTMSVVDAVCLNDGSSATVSAKEEQGGAAADGFNENCSGPVEMTVVCTGTEKEIKDLLKVKPSYSPGWENRPYRDEAILMVCDGEDNFWSTNLDVTWFQILDWDEDGDGNACNTAGCTEAFDVSSYLMGDDPDFAQVYSDDFTSMSFLCRRGDQTISLTAMCDGTDVGEDFSGDIFGALAHDISDFTCSSDDKVLEIRCEDPPEALSW